MRRDYPFRVTEVLLETFHILQTLLIRLKTGIRISHATLSAWLTGKRTISTINRCAITNGQLIFCYRYAAAEGCLPSTDVRLQTDN